MNQIGSFGSPRFLIVPGDAHRRDAKAHKQRYPALTVVPPEGFAWRSHRIRSIRRAAGTGREIVGVELAKTFRFSAGSQEPVSRVFVPRSTHLFSRARI
jgi:hypothetical protein